MCKHLSGLKETECSICLNPNKGTKHITLLELIDLSHQREDWTEEEFDKLYEAFKSIQNIHSKLFREKVKETANKLGRSKYAVIWEFKHMFITQEWIRCHNLFVVMERKTK